MLRFENLGQKIDEEDRGIMDSVSTEVLFLFFIMDLDREDSGPKFTIRL